MTLHLLTVAQVAAELGLSERTVRDQLAADVMHGTRFGRAWMVEMREVNRYRDEHLGRPGVRAKGARP